MWSLMPWKNNQETNSGALSTEMFDREFSRIRHDFDRLLQTMWSGRPGGDLSESFHWLTGGLDENDTHYLAHIEAPGFEAGDFDVQAHGNRLVVKAERKASEEKGNSRRYHYGSLQRSFVLPEGAKLDEVEAHYRNGILELQIPKGEEAKNVKRITVKS